MVYVVIGYMLVGVVGMVCGGFLVVWVEKLECIIVFVMVFVVVLLLLVVIGWLFGGLVVVVVVLVGFGMGLVGLLCDMFIKCVVLLGVMGCVYGIVYLGLDIGFVLVVFVFGVIFDYGLLCGVFVGLVVVLMLGIVFVGLVGLGLVGCRLVVIVV